MVVRRVSTMEGDVLGFGSRGGGGGRSDSFAATEALGVKSSLVSFLMLVVVVVVAVVTGEGEVGVPRRSSRGDSGEKEGKEVKDLSDGAMEDAELDGCEVSLALLLLARTVVDLCELLDRADCSERERSSCSGDVDMGADADVEASMSML